MTMYCCNIDLYQVTQAIYAIVISVFTVVIGIATFKYAKIAKRTFLESFRPLIKTSLAKPYPFRGGDGFKMAVKLKMRNVGRVPANILRVERKYNNGSMDVTETVMADKLAMMPKDSKYILLLFSTEVPNGCKVRIKLDYEGTRSDEYIQIAEFRYDELQEDFILENRSESASENLPRL